MVHVIIPEFYLANHEHIDDLRGKLREGGWDATAIISSHLTLVISVNPLTYHFFQLQHGELQSLEVP